MKLAKIHNNQVINPIKKLYLAKLFLTIEKIYLTITSEYDTDDILCYVNDTEMSIKSLHLHLYTQQTAFSA